MGDHEIPHEHEIPLFQSAPQQLAVTVVHIWDKVT